jgi:hypothetical protein
MRLFEKAEQKLIQMYSELEEPQEKPVIRCKEYEVLEFKKSFIIRFKINNIKQDIFSYCIEEKDGMLITDDFIFVKEALNGRN